MVTTIQLNENVKSDLDRLKSGRKITYEEVILDLINRDEVIKKNKEKLLKEAYRELAGESLRICKEWEGTLMDGLDPNERWEELEEEIL